MGRQRRVVNSTSGAKLNGLVDRTEQLLLPLVNLHQIYRGTQQSPREMTDLLENGDLYPKLELATDARAMFDAMATIDACEPQRSSLTLHFMSVRDRPT